MPEILIRLARAEDAPIILEMIHALARFENESDNVEATINDIVRGGLRRAAGLRVPDRRLRRRPAGFALFFHNFSTWTGRKGIYLEDIFVHEWARAGASARRCSAGSPDWPLNAAVPGSISGPSLEPGARLLRAARHRAHDRVAALSLPRRWPPSAGGGRPAGKGRARVVKGPSIGIRGKQHHERQARRAQTRHQDHRRGRRRAWRQPFLPSGPAAALPLAAGRVRRVLHRAGAGHDGLLRRLRPQPGRGRVRRRPDGGRHGSWHSASAA
jgi:hypothetical protein